MKTLDLYDWKGIFQNINHQGYASLPGLLTGHECDELTGGYSDESLYRKTVVMERHRFGLGEYKYYRYPLPPLIQFLRVSVYARLTPLANEWMRLLSQPVVFPEEHSQFITACRSANQEKPTPLILKYGQGGFNTLHQDLYGEVSFPLQLVISLSQTAVDYQGGELVVTEQVPRAQSKASVITPQKGDGILLTTNFRPVKGVRGYYRTTMRHGVSEVISGSRYAMGIIFHDASS